MKVIHLIFSLGVGGTETMLVDIANQQCRLASVSVVIINDRVDKELLSTFCSKVKVHTLRRQPGNKFDFLFVLKLWALILRERPTALHCHNNTIFPLIQFWRKKIFLTVHATHISMKFLNGFKQVFAISNAVATDIKSRTNIDAKLIYNGIDLKEYSRRKTYSLSETDDFKIIQVSRLKHEIKGQDIAIEALGALRRNFPDVRIHLYFVGEGESKDYLKEMAKKQGVEKNVSFIGQVDRKWVQGKLCDFHLLIQPSRYEGFGLTIVEGLAAGLPVIASDVAGPAEIMKKLNVGSLFATGNVSELQSNILDVYNFYLDGKRPLLDNYFPDSNALNAFDIVNTAESYIRAYT